MANVITRDKLSIISPYPIYAIYDISITHEVNQHSKLSLEGLLTAETNEKLESIINDVKQNDEIQIIAHYDNGDEVLFTGVPNTLEISISQNQGYITMECYSGTYEMDMHEHSRSFQNEKLLYSDLMDQVVNRYPKGRSINTGAKGKVLGRPVIQYKETDWDFLKRMAAREGTVLTPDITTSSAKLWLGIPDSPKIVDVKNQKLVQHLRSETEYQRAGYYYELEMNDCLKIGDKVNQGNRRLVVTQASYTYSSNDGVLRNLYQIERPPVVKPYNNIRIKGVSLEGTVLDVCLNHIKVRLDIDSAQRKDEAFWYPCAGESSNVCYTMPHIGERVNLHIVDSDETGLCMTGTRGTEGEMATTRSMAKPTEKCMETKWHMQMALHERDIEWDMPTVNIRMDEDSITVTSNDKITIESRNEINIGKVETEKTRNIEIEAEELLTLKVTSSESIIELDEYNRIHALRNIKVYGSNKEPVPVVQRVEVGLEEVRPK